MNSYGGVPAEDADLSVLRFVLLCHLDQANRLLILRFSSTIFLLREAACSSLESKRAQKIVLALQCNLLAGLGGTHLHRPLPERLRLVPGRALMHLSTRKLLCLIRTKRS